MSRRRATYVAVGRTAGCRVALHSGIFGCLGSVAFVLSPILLAVLSRMALSRTVELSVETVAVPILVGYALAAGFLTLVAFSQSSVLAWSFSCAAVVAALSVSIFPALAVF